MANCGVNTEEDNILCHEEKEMIILVGPPGCGKSTWTNKVKDPKYVVINQDNYKIKTKMLFSIRIALIKGRSVIIDKRNEYAKDREEIEEIAKKCGASIKILWFDFPRSICEHICAYREIMYGKEIPHIIISKYYSKIKPFDRPTEKEGKIIIKYFNENDIEITNMDLFMQFLV